MPSLVRPGAELWYDVTGDGPALMFFHGRAGNGANWWRQIAHFSSTHRVITVDQRAFGRSRCDPEAFQVEHMVDDIGVILDDCGVTRAALICQSMSGITGLRFALDAPERVAGLVLCSTLGGISTRDIRARLRKIEAANTVELPDRAFSAGYGEREPALYALYKQLLEFNAGFDPAWMKRFSGPEVALTPDSFGTYDVPTTFIVGEHDLYFPPSMAHDVAAYVPAATVIDFAGAGHSAYWEAPDRFNALLTDWLAENARW
ncbi:MAG: alpha/beta hydrolase [Alphaproteobacteria bacterium]|nr:alpha/beta hydrolase [Alphaproteobacteria bacterium]